MPFSINYGLLAFALFFIFVIFYWVYAFITVYHLIRFGVGTQPKKFAAIFLIGSMVIFFLCIILFSTIDVNATFGRIINLLQQLKSSTQ
ncbi:MAG: hypothetical protein V4467_02795 [Patescibacteria group bacterium]